MKSETLIHQHPPTPPNLNVDLQSGFHHLAQYNAGRRFSYEETNGYGAGYASPGSITHDGLPRDIHYDGYNQTTGYFQDGQGNGYTSNHAIFSGSPPTPRSATEIDDAGRRTRSGRTAVPSTSPKNREPPRPKLAPKSRKAKATKSEKPKTPKLTAPLSELTKGMTSIPVRNMEEWVNRSTETRLREVEKRNGYVTRPMNSFMLYRSAFAERTKQWCLQNNHQVVSSVSGESWPLEPDEIRNQYNDYAKIERMNHQTAHPKYKFSPSKTTAPARKRKGEFSDEEPSDLEDAEWNPGHKRSRYRPSRQPDQRVGYMTSGLDSGFFDSTFRNNGVGANKPGWDASHDGRPVPMALAHDDPYNQYYQVPVHAGMGMNQAMLEDMRFRRVDSPSLQFAPDQALLGLPGGTAVDLMQQLHSQAGTPLGGEPQVDPMLLAYDSSHHVEATPAQHPEFRNGSMTMLDKELEQQNTQRYLDRVAIEDEYRPDPWQPDSGIGTIELESEFDKWGLVGDQQP
ncbi:unnamed protein product [Periconia digitata]|uniref:HMG box domain-containing protein n=1 Tax=Periconia digitata TaxID=1303443 RepID=A0A9W4U2A3_9PLEO|nr:unnamed protein product [Periconia digitata]